jgi:hypothetical protein
MHTNKLRRLQRLEEKQASAKANNPCRRKGIICKMAIQQYGVHYKRDNQDERKKL